MRNESGLGHDDQGAEPYTPPTDPVIEISERGDAEILGGFAESSTDEAIERPTAELDDEALAVAIRRELRHDALTTRFDVTVTVKDGVAYLRGRVDGPEDVEAVEEVAGRVSGISEVVEQLEMAAAG